MTLLEIADYKAIVGRTSATDAAITAALAASEEEINEAAGPLGDLTESWRGGHSQVMFGQRAVLLVRVIERVGIQVIELDPADYSLSSSGGYAVRLSSGPHPSRVWRQPEIRYEPYSNVNLRKTVQAELVALDVGDPIGANAGQRTQERIGEWSESYATTSVALNPQQRREAILARLTPSTFPYWEASGHSSVSGPAGS